MDARYSQKPDQGGSAGGAAIPDGREAWRRARSMLQELDTKCAERALDYQALYKELEGLKAQTRGFEEERQWMQQEIAKATASTNAAYDAQRRIDGELAAAEAEAVQLARQLQLIKEREEQEMEQLEAIKDMLSTHQAEQADFQCGGDDAANAELLRMAKRAMRRGEGPGYAADVADGASELAAGGGRSVLPPKWWDEWRRAESGAAAPN